MFLLKNDENSNFDEEIAARNLVFNNKKINDILWQKLNFEKTKLLKSKKTIRTYEYIEFLMQNSDPNPKLDQTQNPILTNV